MIKSPPVFAPLRDPVSTSAIRRVTAFVNSGMIFLPLVAALVNFVILSSPIE